MAPTAPTTARLSQAQLPANDEPRHDDEDGKSVVGAVDLRRDIDATTD